MNGSLKKFFRRLDEAGTPVADRNGALWMEFSDGDESSRIGLSANNVFSSGTDTDLAYQLVLARVGHVLKSPKHSRESMVEFKKDWNLLQSVRVRSRQRSGKGVDAPPGGAAACPLRQRIVRQHFLQRKLILISAQTYSSHHFLLTCANFSPFASCLSCYDSLPAMRVYA